MTALMNPPIRISAGIIGFSKKEVEIIKRNLRKSAMEEVLVINLHLLNNYSKFPNYFPKFKRLVEKSTHFKILWSETEEGMKNLPASLGWQNRIDITYSVGELKFGKRLIRNYLKWKFSVKPTKSDSVF